VIEVICRANSLDRRELAPRSGGRGETHVAVNNSPLRRGDLGPSHRRYPVLLPSKLEQLRTGHWAVEHFLGYFAAASIVCLGWPRALVVAGLFLPFAAVLEGLQALTPDDTPAVLSAVSGASGALAAALLIKIIIERQRWLRLAGGQDPEERGAAH
jgi:hypothetical protein